MVEDNVGQPVKRAGAPPPIGPVTVVFLDKVYLGRWRRGTVRRHRSHQLIQANVKRSDEGITWIRGHHDRRSAEVKALLAAYSMRPRRVYLSDDEIDAAAWDRLENTTAGLGSK